MRETLLEKLSQLDAFISRRYVGLGLGFSICTMMVEALGSRTANRSFRRWCTRYDGAPGTWGGT